MKRGQQKMFSQNSFKTKESEKVPISCVVQTNLHMFYPKVLYMLHSFYLLLKVHPAWVIAL